MKRKFLLLILSFLLVNLALAQSNKENINDIVELYKQLNYETAKVKAINVTKNWQKYSMTELLEVHKILGVIYYSEGSVTESRSQFEQALSLNSSLTLDAVLFSPKIISFFNEIKANYKPQTSLAPEFQIRYLMIPDPRPKAALHSMLIPGWGQMIKGHKTKGKILITLAGGNLISLGTLFILQKKYYDDYINATDPDDISGKYNTYNQIYQAQQICTYLTGVIWLYSVADALISQPKSFNKITLTPSINKEAYSLNIALRF